MTKQDYIKLAELIKENSDNIGDSDNQINKFVIYKDSFLNGLCGVLKSDNPRFDEVKFREACEY
jgi:hypothetical protein